MKEGLEILETAKVEFWEKIISISSEVEDLYKEVRDVDKYEAQLEQLKDQGFFNEDVNPS